MGILKGVDSMKKTLAWVCLLAMLFSFSALGETRLFSVNDYESSYTFSFAQAGVNIVVDLINVAALTEKSGDAVHIGVAAAG